MFGNNFIGGVARNSFNLPRILDGLSKTLGIVNRAIPLYRQAKPMIEKGKSLFKMVNEINKTTTTKTINKTPKIPKKETLSTKSISSNQPIFFQ